MRDLVSGKQLMTVLLKLFSFCVRVKSNRQQLIRTEMNSISIMLGALNLVSLWRSPGLPRPFCVSGFWFVMKETLHI